jgi:hypothetical protein
LGPELVLQSLATPPRLGKYEIVSQLGAGGMARVYLAVHRTPVASKVVVLKHVRAEFAEDPDFAAMFMDEARVALRLSHRNVIHAYEASSSAGHQYLAMEFLEGKTLFQLLRAVGHQHMPIRVHISILCDVLSGLQYAHGLTDFDGTPLGIVHRDVSPSNVFVTRTGEVKLVDFGIAKLAGAVAETKTGKIKGKIGYASPEQCLGRTVDARTDLYPVGVMLWEALARRRRPSPETASSTVPSRQSSEFDLGEIRPRLPDALLAIARKALALDPEQRYPSAAAFLRDLTGYLDRLPGPAPNRLAAQLMELNFGADFARVRQSIDGHMGPGSAPAIRVSGEAGGLPAPAGPAPVVTPRSTTAKLPRTAKRGRLRAAFPWSIGALLLLAASAWVPWNYAAVDPPIASAAVRIPVPAAARVEPASVVAGEASKPVLVSELPLETPRVVTPSPAPVDGARRAAPSEARRTTSSLRAPAPPAHRALAPGSVHNVRVPSATLPVAGLPPAQLVEPGFVLTSKAIHSSTHSLDEKDPYLP